MLLFFPAYFTVSPSLILECLVLLPMPNRTLSTSVPLVVLEMQSWIICTTSWSTQYYWSVGKVHTTYPIVFNGTTCTIFRSVARSVPTNNRAEKLLQIRYRLPREATSAPRQHGLGESIPGPAVDHVWYCLQQETIVAEGASEWAYTTDEQVQG